MGTELEARALVALGGVLARGVRPTDQEWMEAVPVLAEALAPFAGADDLRAEHQRVLGQGVFAFESVFRSPQGLRGGDHAHASAWAYATAGMAPTDDLDALGEQTRLMGHLLECDPEAADAFFSKHLGMWAPAALVAIERQGSPLYASLAELLKEIFTPRMTEVQERWVPVEDWLDQPKTGIKDIVAHMLIPDRSGWFLSRSDLIRWSTEVGIPCGFGSRQQMLQGLFMGAVEHREVPQWLDYVGQECARWGERYLAFGATGWAERVDRLAKDLARVGEAAAARESSQQD